MGGAWETLDHADGTSEARPVQEGIVMVPVMTMDRRLAEDRRPAGVVEPRLEPHGAVARAHVHGALRPRLGVGVVVAVADARRHAGPAGEQHLRRGDLVRRGGRPGEEGLHAGRRDVDRVAGACGGDPLVELGAHELQALVGPEVLGGLVEELLHREAFRRIYAPGTRQNRAGRPGLYRFFLAHTWSTSLLDDGPYSIEVEASDLRGNVGRLALPFTIANDI